jgi:RNA polymerase sigma factor (sigma-70 family)
MENDADWHAWMVRLVEADTDAEQQFWNLYGDRLQRLASQHLSSGLRRRVGAEDVVQSACRTFLRRVQEGQFEFSDAESLWRLLCAITLTKVRQQARFHGRQKRAINQERHPAVDQALSRAGHIISPEPTPAEAIEFADQLEQLLGLLNDEERTAVILKLEQNTNNEVAQQLCCSERTVRRIIGRIQTQWKKNLLESSAP